MKFIKVIKVSVTVLSITIIASSVWFFRAEKKRHEISIAYMMAVESSLKCLRESNANFDAMLSTKDTAEQRKYREKITECDTKRTAILDSIFMQE